MRCLQTCAELDDELVMIQSFKSGIFWQGNMQYSGPQGLGLDSPALDTRPWDLADVAASFCDMYYRLAGLTLP